MNAGDRRGPLGSHSFILGHTPRLTSFYCAVSRSPARTFKQLAPSTLAIAFGRRRAAVRFLASAKHLLFAFSIDRHLDTVAVRPDVTVPSPRLLYCKHIHTTRVDGVRGRDVSGGYVSPHPPSSTLLMSRPARTVREWPKHRKNALDFVERNQTGSEPPRRLHSNSRRNPSL